MGITQRMSYPVTPYSLVAARVFVALSRVAYGENKGEVSEFADSFATDLSPGAQDVLNRLTFMLAFWCLDHVQDVLPIGSVATRDWRARLMKSVKIVKEARCQGGPMHPLHEQFTAKG